MQPQRAKELLATYYDQNKNNKLDEGEFLVFEVSKHANKISAYFNDTTPHTKSITIYNPTRPIYNNGKRYLVGRVEPLEAEVSKIMFFEELEGIWRLIDEAPVLGLQDPFYIENVHGYNIIGGVKTFPRDHKPDELDYRTVFYRYKEDLLELINYQSGVAKPFAEGPKGMKDIRLIELANGKIGVFTRPQGGSAGPGKIGYVEIDSLDQLEEMIPRAKILEGLFHHEEWGGANDLHILKNGKIGVLGHIAYFDNSQRHYYAMTFVFDPRTQTHSHLEILTTADDFPPVKPKKTTIGKVIFSGGLIRKDDGTADLYVGVGDIQSGKIRIKDPFLKHEKD